MTLVLGLDIGSTSTKAALVDVTDGVRVVHVERRPTSSDPHQLLAGAAEVTRSCGARAGSPIAAIGVASMAESGTALAAYGTPLTGMLRWDRAVDRAHLDHLLTLRPGLPARTGVPATTKPAAVALIALATAQPEALRALRHWSGAADLIGHALTGVRAVDHTLAARTMLAGADGDRWDEGLLTDLGIPLHVLPALRAPGRRVGFTTGAAATFGLRPGIPLHIAGHDHAVGAWAAGARVPGDAADSLGTAEAVVRVAADVDRAGAVAAGFAVSRTVDGAAVTVLGGSRSCGALLALWESRHPGTIALLSEQDPADWSTSPVTVLPYPAGRQCPRPDADAELQVLGVGEDDALARGLLQSLVSHARWMRETADELAGGPCTSLVLLGSLAHRIPAWPALTAATGLPVRLVAHDEPVAAGAALLAAVREHVASPDATLPSSAVAPSAAPGLDEAHDRFLAAVHDQLSTRTARTPQGER
ncbi:FGGY family carbohydrate kinase [Microbacterium sp.]|uniref:FGGY family carbohydrate kinase n=1 Tax=Microbacterium sp. TaxID=51671 RepID=UPI0028121874|nr:FGGY family carbohydrate kinase [Microbacterium sp.]